MSSSDVTLDQVHKLLPVAVVLVNIDGEILSLNPAASNLMGLEPGQRLQDGVTESSEAIVAMLVRAARSYDPVPGRVTLRRDDSEPLACRVTGARLKRDGSEKPVIFLALESLVAASQHRSFVFLNQTIEAFKHELGARRRSEALLKAQKKLLAGVVGGVPLGEALQILCRTVEEHSAGMLVSILLLKRNGQLRHAASPSLPVAYSEAIDGLEIGPGVGSCGTAAYTGKQVIVEDIANHPYWAPFVELALSHHLAACWSTPIMSSDAEVLGTLALYYKTPRAPTQDELKLIEDSAVVAGLAIERHKIRIREQKLLRKTRRERERAKRENRAKDMFLAVLSHELRNPLSAISNAANALAAEDGSDEFESRLQRVVINESRQLKRILDDLLDLSRLSRGKFRLQMDALEVADLWQEMRSALVAAYSQRKLHFEVRGDPGWMNADRSRLRQSLQNLVDNAVKYSDDDTRIEIILQADEKYLRFSVVDQGEGISKELLPKVFDPFVQSDESLERTRSGLGLGLALVKRFCQMHGGQVEVDSPGPGQGSRFSLCLPRGEVEIPAPEEKAALVGNGPSRVLVVEDNADARLGLCQLLEIWGHEVRFAGDGSEALAVMRDQVPHIALVDIGLPKMNGYQFAEAVRQDPALANVRLIALTGYGQEADRLRAHRAGFDDHIVKPADAQDLIRVLGEPQAVA